MLLLTPPVLTRAAFDFILFHYAEGRGENGDG